jgi:hypothetical protein
VGAGKLKWLIWWRNSYQVLVGKTDHLEDVGLVMGITLKEILQKWYRKVWTGFIWVRTETSGGVEQRW